MGKDGWATYFKFLGRKMFQCNKVLAFDADVHFKELYKANNTRRSGRDIEMKLLSGPAEEFSATREVANRGYDGLNVHAMIFTPSQDAYDLFIETAKSGNFVPYTQGEQDVIESLVFQGKFNLTSTRVESLPLAHERAYQFTGDRPWIVETAKNDENELRAQEKSDGTK